MPKITPLWENPEIQGINRLPMRSPLLPFPSPEAAIINTLAGPEYRNPQADPYNLSLDGTWSFKLLHNPQDDSGPRGAAPEASPEWTRPGYDISQWHTIQVPGTWTLQGSKDSEFFDKPHYTNVQMPFDKIPPQAPEYNPTGLYRRGFTVPRTWKDRRVVLHIGSAESCCMVYINGNFAGAGKDTRLPQEYDITPFLEEAETENALCLKVVRYSDASYMEDQDQWWFGGLHRSVFLYSTEDCYILDVKALPGAARDKTGLLQLAVTLGGKLPAGKSTGNVAVSNFSHDKRNSFTIRYSLYPFALPSDLTDAETTGKKLTQNNRSLVSEEMILNCNYRLNSNTVEADLVLPAVKEWSHEKPNLYILSVSLFREGKHIESIAFCTGFRSVRVAKRELLINEKPVLIKGVNRHEHDEKNGKTLSTSAMLRDIMLLKQHNFNAVRTCHYPNDERWYELCDRYGIYLVDEANIEHHCFYDQLCRDTAWSYAYISRVQRMAERDKNHPSVIIWSLGNESGDGGNNTLCGAWIRRYDGSRPVHYEGAIRPERGQGAFTLDSLCRGRNVTDIIGPMYPSIELITDFVKYREDERPLIMCEYSHAMGNSNGSLADYWEAIENYHGLQGGFIWDWIDQGIEVFTPGGVKYWKYGGDFDDEPTDYDFCLNGILFPDQTPKPVMADCKQLFCPVKVKPVSGKPHAFIIENHFDFSSLDHLLLQWQLCTETAVIANGTENFPTIAPGNSLEITLPILQLLKAVNECGILFIHIDICQKDTAPWAGPGFVIGSAEQVIRERLPWLPIQKAAASGELQNNKSLEDFAQSFKPCLFRVPTENDGLKTYVHLRGDPAATFYYQDKAMYPWLDLDLLNLQCIDVSIEPCTLDAAPAIRYTANLFSGNGAIEECRNTKLGSYSCITVRDDSSHSLILDISFDLDPSLPELPRVGVSAKVPSLYNSITWFGAGPHESYPDRCAGTFLGWYSDTPASLEVPYIVPQENGNRMGVRSIALSNAQGNATAISILPASPVQLSAQRYAPENSLDALHTYDLVDLSQGTDGYYYLHIDCAQRGIGTAACGPDTLEQYRIRPGIFRMRLYLYEERSMNIK
jgi:beta-galactosidase